MTTDSLDMLPVEELRADFRGTILRPGDDGYVEVKQVYNGMFNHRTPQLIARCTGTADVIAAVRWARENDVLLAVRAGGHSVAGYSICDGGLVVDLSPMTGVQVYPDAKRVRAQGGATWGDFDRETQVYGLACTGGRVSTTGIAGLTLGSGSGWLERALGLTADSLVAADVVTADGSVVRASEDENADLFWGLRGGTGNFGIVTSFEYGLYEVGPYLNAGLLLYSLDDAERVLRQWREFMLTAPDELTTGVVFVTMPEAPFVPGELRKKLSLGIFCCYAGDPDRGEAVLASLRRIGPPLADLVRPTPYVDIQQSIDALNPPGRLNYWRSENLSELPDEAIDTLTHYARNVTSPFSYVTLEPKGGAIARVDADDTALSVRDMAYAYYALAVWEDPSDDDRHIAWVREFAQAMSPYTMPGMLLNFVMDEGEQRIRSTYGQRQYDRLVALKDKYDLTNIFRHNQNIPPSGRIEKS